MDGIVWTAYIQRANSSDVAISEFGERHLSCRRSSILKAAVNTLQSGFCERRKWLQRLLTINTELHPCKVQSAALQVCRMTSFKLEFVVIKCKVGKAYGFCSLVALRFCSVNRQQRMRKAAVFRARVFGMADKEGSKAGFCKGPLAGLE